MHLDYGALPALARRARRRRDRPSERSASRSAALAREVRAASLLAFLLSLPIAFLALVPSGAVSAGLYDVIRAVSALFPFKPALQAIDAALNDADPGIAGPLAHLAVLAVAYVAIARTALRRFA